MDKLRIIDWVFLGYITFSVLTRITKYEVENMIISMYETVSELANKVTIIVARFDNHVNETEEMDGKY